MFTDAVPNTFQVGEMTSDRLFDDLSQCSSDGSESIAHIRVTFVSSILHGDTHVEMCAIDPDAIRQMNVKVESQVTFSFHLKSVWCCVGKQSSLFMYANLHYNLCIKSRYDCSNTKVQRLACGE